MFDYDYIIVGSGFGGSVCALRLVEKGYKVLLIEKGPRYRPQDLPINNWHLKKWLWWPSLGWRGPFKMTFFRHVTVFSGVGFGGGSIIYANTLPIPRKEFFEAESWRHLGSWQTELAPHYQTARRMVGAEPNRYMNRTDEIMREVADELGLKDATEAPHVAVYFGKRNVTVPDPYFGGRGPARTGCNECGGCMLGCRFGAKNTLDKNYLYLAEQAGLSVLTDTLVDQVKPLRDGYCVRIRSSKSRFGATRVLTAKHVILSGGVLGTVELLFKMRAEGHLSKLSPKLGAFIRTNNESITGVVARNNHDFSRGLAITSIVNTDPHSHVEPVRYNRDSSFFRLLMFPHGPGATIFQRLGAAMARFRKDWPQWIKVAFGRQFGRRVQMLLFMRSLEGTLEFSWRSRPFRLMRGSLGSRLTPGSAKPTSAIPEATEFAERFAAKVDGVVASLITETIADIPSTAHILGGCAMGTDADEGVIDSKHEVFGYPGLYVIDGSAVSANPGVNPSLTIMALAERAMSFVPPKSSSPEGI